MGRSKTGVRSSATLFDPDAPPLSAGIPMILGNAHDETRLLIGSSDPSAFALRWETLPAKLQQHAKVFGRLDLAQVIRQYRDMYPADSLSDIFFAARQHLAHGAAN
jgi:para-nitrobenzyl esterase